MTRVSFNKKRHTKDLLRGLSEHQHDGVYRLEETSRNINLFLGFEGKDKDFKEINQYIKALEVKIYADIMHNNYKERLLAKMKEK